MNLAQALRLLTSQPFPVSTSKSNRSRAEKDGVAFVGAGGKSTALFQLARQLSPPVVVSATTHLGVWQIPLADKHYILREKKDIQVLPNGVTLVTDEVKGDRASGLDSESILWLHEVCKGISVPLLIEADGSRQKPFKAPAKHEPSIPNFVGTVVIVAGLSGLGKPLDEDTVHRPEIFAKLSGLQPGETITLEGLARALVHHEGGLKNIPSGIRRVILLNQADAPELQAQADFLAKGLLPVYHSAIIASLKKRNIYAVHESIAGIILAAGEAQRFGQPKQLLDWRGEPFVRRIAKTALESGLSPVIVVTGAYADQVKATVEDLPVQIAHNVEWKSGQASSIKAGLEALSGYPKISENLEKEVGGAIFLLADQPQVTPTLLQALVEEHASTLAPIIAPLVLDQRANPVLFDRVTFPDLMVLEGDMGGRGIFSKHKVSYLTWHDDAMLLDVDKPEHYQRLKDLLE